jgi:hypothetical protein
VCANTSGLPTSATAEVTGPGGELLETHVQLGTPSSSATTAVQFTPEQPGPHHVLIEFAPQGGLHQVDVHAAVDRTAETPSQTLPRICNSLERTLQGAWVCDSSVLRGNEVLESFPNSRLAVAGDAIWVVDGQNIRRYVDTGTAITLTGTIARPFVGLEFLLPSPNELVLLGSSLGLFTFQGGVVAAGGATPWTRPSSQITSDSPYAVLLRDGGHLAIASRVSSATAPTFQVCPYQLLAGRFERTPGDCPRFPGEIIGFEHDVLWTRDQPPSSAAPTPVQLRRWVWAGGQLTEQGSLTLGIHVFVFTAARLRNSVVPLVHNAPHVSSFPIQPQAEFPSTYSLVTWSPQRKALVLEHLDEVLTSGYASTSLYWGFVPPSPSSAMRARIRLPTP